MKLSVFGIGYVGCVSAACFAKAGHDVIGVDLNPTKVEIINSGKSPIVEAGIDELIAAEVAAGTLASNHLFNRSNHEFRRFACLRRHPEQRKRQPRSQSRQTCLRGNRCSLKRKDERHTVVIRSTMLPGTIEGLVVPTLGRKFRQAEPARTLAFALIPNFCAREVH